MTSEDSRSWVGFEKISGGGAGGAEISAEGKLVVEERKTELGLEVEVSGVVGLRIGERSLLEGIFKSLISCASDDRGRIHDNNSRDGDSGEE